MEGRDEDARPWVLVTDVPAIKVQRVILERHFRSVIWKDFLENAEAYRHKIQGILYIPHIKPPMSEEFLKSMPNLKVLANHGIGINHLDLPLLRKVGIKASRAFGVLDDTCADFIFGLLIAAARRLPECMKEAQGYDRSGGGYDHAQGSSPEGVKVSGATIGILGMGAIGFEVARRASLGFKMTVLYHNRSRRKEEEEREVKATYCKSLAEMLPLVDFLVISCSLNDDSRHLIGKQELSQMKSNAIIVNGARGQVIDQETLVEALQSGTIRGAALDAQDPEPLHKDHPLLHMANVIVTGHFSSFVTETMGKMMQNCVDNLWAGIEGRPLPTEIDLAP